MQSQKKFDVPNREYNLINSPKNSDLKKNRVASRNIQQSNISMRSGRSSKRGLSNLNELRNQRKNSKSISKINAYLSNMSSQDNDFQDEKRMIHLTKIKDLQAQLKDMNDHLFDNSKRMRSNSLIKSPVNLIQSQT